MTTKKVNLAYITGDSTRKATFMNRKTGFKKKMKEITILCDIDTCAIIYSPYDREPVVLSSSSGIQQVLTRFKTMPERKQSNKVLNSMHIVMVFPFLSLCFKLGLLHVMSILMLN
ncbi:hypothetical protein TIFTF001_000010 [Ficus carica]|uniref:MADS-box domain-containing protein n=1 Tax=Ficus carica TaxID=3494 RepID=A0AA88CM73_FICCA|nr:hypothetical protein TIFTF001_000010 [Ficus carica]